ncbi:MAG: hypothetical protein AAF432_00840 [Planctomycetota bacterium]
MQRKVLRGVTPSFDASSVDLVDLSFGSARHRLSRAFVALTAYRLSSPCDRLARGQASAGLFDDPLIRSARIFRVMRLVHALSCCRRRCTDHAMRVLLGVMVLGVMVLMARLRPQAASE